MRDGWPHGPERFEDALRWSGGRVVIELPREIEGEEPTLT